MQSTDRLSQQNNYIQMSNMTSGASSSFLNTKNSLVSSLFISIQESKPNCCLPESPELDETSSKDEANQENDSNSNVVYNFP